MTSSVVIPKIFARVLIKNPSNQLLIVKQKTSLGFLWNFPGGKVELNESPKQAAIRETEEELGLRIHNVSYLLRNNFLINNQTWQGNFFYAHSFSGVPVIKEPEKIFEVKYVPIDELHTYPSIKEVFSDIGKLQIVTDLGYSLEKF